MRKGPEYVSVPTALAQCAPGGGGGEEGGRGYNLSITVPVLQMGTWRPKTVS